MKERQDFKLSFYKDFIKFFVNENDRTVCCVLKAKLYIPSLCFHYQEEFTVNGISKCHGDDVFDIERGKRIALAKAENKAYKVACKYVDKDVRDALNFIEKATYFLDKSDIQCDHNIEYIESISNEEHPLYRENLSELKRGTTKFIE